MGETTAITWTNHTFNAWWGCTKVGNSPACDKCYAERDSNRYGFKIWGNDADRRFFKPAHWSCLLDWNKKAESAGERRRVFFMSMGDWAEGRPDQRESLELTWEYFDKTPWLDKLLLTKRPQLIPTLLPERFKGRTDIWQGTTTETQYWLDLRWDLLKRTPAAVYWLSIEPMLEAMNLPPDFLALGSRGWVIVGGESGGGARPIDPAWARRLRDQCTESGNRFHMKQMSGTTKAELQNIPLDLLIRQYPEARQ